MCIVLHRLREFDAFSRFVEIFHIECQLFRQQFAARIVGGEINNETSRPDSRGQQVPTKVRHDNIPRLLPLRQRLEDVNRPSAEPGAGPSHSDHLR